MRKTLLCLLCLNSMGTIFGQSFKSTAIDPYNLGYKSYIDYLNPLSNGDSTFSFMYKHVSADGDEGEKRLVSYNYEGKIIDDQLLAYDGFLLGSSVQVPMIKKVNNTTEVASYSIEYGFLTDAQISCSNLRVHESTILDFTHSFDSSIYFTGVYYASILAVSAGNRDTTLWENICSSDQCISDYKNASPLRRENHSAYLLQVDQNTGELLASHTFTGRNVSVNQLESDMTGSKIFFKGIYRDSLMFDNSLLFTEQDSGIYRSFYGLLEDDTLQWIKRNALPGEILVDNANLLLRWYGNFYSTFTLGSKTIEKTDQTNTFEWIISFDGDFLELNALPIVGSNHIGKIRDSKIYLASEFSNFTVGDSIVHSNTQGQRDIALIQLDGSNITAYSHTGSTKADVLKGFDLDENSNLNVFAKYSWNGVKSSNNHNQGLEANLFYTQEQLISPANILRYSCAGWDRCRENVTDDLLFSDISKIKPIYSLQCSGYADFRNFIFNDTNAQRIKGDGCWNNDVYRFDMHRRGLPQDSTVYFRIISKESRNSNDSTVSNTIEYKTMSWFPQKVETPVQYSSDSVTINYEYIHNDSYCFGPWLKFMRIDQNSDTIEIEEFRELGQGKGTVVDKNISYGDSYTYFFKLWFSWTIGQTVSIYIKDSIPRPSSLTAELVNNKMNLEWLDNSTNESGFVLERAYDSLFSQVNKTFELDADQISYIDQEIEDGKTYYYRIKGINENTESSWSNVAMVEVPVVLSSSSLDQSGFTIYPNPSDDFVMVELPNQSSLPILSVYDLTGNLILEQTFSGKQRVDGLMSGIYIFKIDDGLAPIFKRVIIIKN